jgi:hypothetical protein
MSDKKVYALILIVTILSWAAYPVDYQHNDKKRCVNYLLDGTLYGGQPECASSPLEFFVAAFAPSHLQGAWFYIIMLLSVLFGFKMIEAASGVEIIL